MSYYADIRHRLHEHPQTAGNEQYAHDLIVGHLQGLHPDHVFTRVGGWGVVAVWDPSAQPAESDPIPAVAFRADTDALPSGHRCGHDGHTTVMLRMAELTDQRPRPASHATILVWQPAEETGQGAGAVLESGILQRYNVRAIFGMHNIPGQPLGSVVLCQDTFAAASTGIVYRLEGRQTHASTPEMGINPGLAVAEIIKRFDAFNTRVSAGQKIDDFRQSTLICVHLGDPAFGTSAGHAEIMFTLRAFTNKAMEQLLAEANHAVDEVAAAFGLSVSRMLQEPFHATENTPACVAAVESAARQLKYEVRQQALPFRWSEDFAEYLIRFPGAMFGMGSGENQPELHHPDYDFPDALVEPAAQLFFRLTTEC